MKRVANSFEILIFNEVKPLVFIPIYEGSNNYLHCILISIKERRKKKIEGKNARCQVTKQLFTFWPKQFYNQIKAVTPLNVFLEWFFLEV